MTNDIPKHHLLAKLLRMTSSSNDGEALTAIRKANALLRSAGWDWDKLLEAKIKVVGDPFAGLGTPFNPINRAPPPTTPVRPAAPAAAPKQAPPPRPAPKPFEPWSHRSTQGQSNIYPGSCYVCGHSVSAKAGKLFVPHQFNSHATKQKKPICDTCDNDKFAYIGSKPAPQPKAANTAVPGLNDL